MADIALQGITKRYADGTLAVDGLSLEVADGEFMILVGPSGCGKSTALRMVAGLEEITEGDLLIGGRRVNHLEPKERDIAMVFQNYALYPHMTVARNLGFALKMARVGADEIDRRVREAAEILDLTEHLDRRPGQLSGGQRQRVAMGRAIVREPEAFLMDEPLSNLDAKLRVQMRAEIARIQQRLDTTTIYVTHDQTEAMTLGDRVAVLRGGVLQQVATPRELYAQPANLFVATFMGSPAMNTMNGELEDGGAAVRTPLGRLALPPALAAAARAHDGGRTVVVGVRPEAFAERADAADGLAPVGARVELVESVGSDVYAYLAAGASSLVARLSAASGVRVGDELRLGLDVGQLHLFGADEEGAAIRTAAAGAPAGR
jgi:multiple sugar transport system ATP-binding protein